MSGHEDDINCVRAFGGGLGVASGSDDATVRLWDVRARRARQVFEPRPESSTLPSYNALSGVTAIDFTARGRYLLATADDGTLRVWDVASGALELCTTPADGSSYRLSSVAVSPDGLAVATSGWGSCTLHVW